MTEVNQKLKFDLFSKKNLKITLPAAAAILAAAIFLIVTASASAGENIRNGVYIGEVNVGGMSRDQAKEAMEKAALRIKDAGVVKINFEETTSEVSFDMLVKGCDIDKAVSSAYAEGRGRGFVLNGIKTMSLKKKPVYIPLEPIFDTEALTQFIGTYATDLDKPLIENFYEVKNDKLRLVNGESGYEIDREHATEDIKKVISTGRSGEVVINKIGKEPIPFDVEAIYNDVAKPPVNAAYETRDGKTYLVKAKNGYDFDREELRRLIEENKDNDKAYYLDLKIVRPEITVVNTDGMFGEILGEYTSKITDSNSNRLNNVRLAASKINGIVINPGEEFRYLPVVEPITVAGGYKTANVYNNGKVEQDIGGGVCQVSSALYTAVLYADLEVTKRYNHSLTVGYVPLGQDATVASGEIDFRFINNTNAPVKIVTAFANTGITVKLLGEKPDKSLKIELENITVKTNNYETIVTDDPNLAAGEVVTDVKGRTGYVVETYKNYYRNGQFVERKYVSKSVYKTITRQQRRGAAKAAETAALPIEKPIVPSDEKPEEALIQNENGDSEEETTGTAGAESEESLSSEEE